MNDNPEKSWQARIGEATDAIAQKFVESISYDRRIYKQDIAGSIAHATMLAKVGLITDAERDAIVEGLKSIERDIESGNFVFDESLEDIHMVVEDAFIKRIGEPGKKLHTGRSRNDQVALDLRMWLREIAWDLESQIQDLCKAFVALAERSSDIVMPSFTHLQRAQPIAAASRSPRLVRDNVFERDDFLVDSAAHFTVDDTSPLGSGAIAGSSLANSDRFRHRDEISAAKANSVTNVFSNSIRRRFPSAGNRTHGLTRFGCVLPMFALAMISQHLSRWAEQWIIYMTTEFGFIKIADRYTTSSSMMPQKRNPDMLELIRGRCGNVYGDLFALMTILKGSADRLQPRSAGRQTHRLPSV